MSKTLAHTIHDRKAKNSRQARKKIAASLGALLKKASRARENSPTVEYKIYRARRRGCYCLNEIPTLGKNSE